MPSVSKKQQKFMGIVRSIQKGEQPASKFSKSAQKAAKKMKKSSVKKYAKTKHDDLPVKKESLSKSQIKKMRDEFDKTGELPPHLKKIVKGKKEFEKKFKVKDIEIPGLEWMSKLGEAADRDYKAEYKKFQSSTKAKKYRAELNKYNRQKGTYGNGDGKDASHKGGKIVGFEKESTNRGRAEKSRLKKEINDYVGNILEDLCLCEACQKGYMTHPTRKTKIMFGKRYRNCIKKEDVNEAVYKLKRGSTNKDLDELDALMARAGFKGKPDFNKMTWSIKNKNPKIAKIIKSKGGKKIREGTCGYGIDGKIGEEPAGPNLMKKIKKISKDKEKKKLLKSKKEGVNEAGMELKKLEDAIKMFQKKIKKQGRVTNARDEDHLENLIKIYKQMGGKKIKEAVKLKGKSGMGKISHLGVPQPSKGVEKLFKIADKGFDKVGGVTVDGMSASLFKQIYNKANDDIKNKLNKKSEKELVRIIGRMWDKFGKNVKIGSSL